MKRKTPISLMFLFASLLLAIVLSQSVTIGADRILQTSIKLKTPKKATRGEEKLDAVKVSIWIPEGVKVLRGIIVNPFYIYLVEREDYHEVARLWEFGLIGANFFGVKNEDYDALLVAMKDFAEKSGHREIEHLPMVFNGFSAGSGMLMKMASMWPERVIACGPVGLEVGPETPKTRKIPVLTIFGEKDMHQMEILTRKLPEQRKEGAFWGIAVNWGLRHDYENANDLIWPFFDQVIRHRLPKNQTTLNGPVKLRDYREEDGWLGDISTWDSSYATINSYKDYKGDRTKAAWFPNEYVARTWQGFVSRRPILAIKEPVSKPEEKTTLFARTQFPIITTSSIPLKAKRIDYFDGCHPLTRKIIAANKVVVRGVETGVRALIAISAVGDKQVISKPVAVVVKEAPKRPGPLEGKVSIVLDRALFQDRIVDGKSYKGPPVPLYLETVNEDGEWHGVIGNAPSFNRSHHRGRVLNSQMSPQRVDLAIEMNINSDPWVPGGRAVYEIMLKLVGENQFEGVFTGMFRGKRMTGKSSAERIEVPQPAEDFVPLEYDKHPFILWNKEDIAAIRKKIETEAWAKAAYEKLVNEPERHEKAFSNLFQHAIMGDEEAAEKDKKELIRMVKSPMPRGAAQYINVIRYDLLYGSLTPDERKEVEEAFRIYIENQIFKRAILDPKIFNDSKNFSRYDARKYTRTNWLPNIIWPWKVSSNLMAAALGDEALIRKVWGAYGSWKWYFDEYLCDIGFYSEEFGKMGSTPGAMLLYCRALERLGLNELGYGYKGKGGATLRGHIESLIHLGYPRLDVGSGRPQYPMLTIGDLRQSGSSQSWNLPSPAFQYSIVMGYTPDGKGGNERWKAHGAWGGVIRGNHAQWDGYGGFTPKMQIPFWFEVGHALRPEIGFDYFLAQMRGPDEDKYYPSLFFGLDAIEPAKVKAPSAPSAVWPERGLVMLRANESPAYWESPAPAIAMRLATNYAHNVIDCFSLCGFYAFNRPIYLNRQVTPGYAQDWSRSIQSHCGVTVDGKEPKFTNETKSRQAFTKAVKFVAARSSSVFEGIDLTRSLMLTNEYCLDVTRLAGEKEHSYYWLIHVLGKVQSKQPENWKEAKLPKDLEPLKQVQRLDVSNKPWSVTAIQTCALEDPSKAKLPKEWYERKIGVRFQMLGGEDTTAYTAQTPLVVSRFRDEKGERQYKEVPSEVGGVTIVAERKAPRTTFVALHEPFKGGKSNIYEFRTIKQTDEGVVVSIVGKYDTGIDDRLMIRLGDNHEKPVTLADDRESFTFADWAYVRISKDKVEVQGDMRVLRIAVQGKPKLLVNGKNQIASFIRGYLYYCVLPE